MRIVIFIVLLCYSSIIKHDLQKLQYIKSIQLSEKEQSCLIKNAYHEAFNQGKIGMALVTQVVINRAYSSNKTFCETIYAPFQFSWTIYKERKIAKNHFEEIREIVLDTYYGRIEIPSDFKNVTFFHSNKINPYWSKYFIKAGVWKDHTFYKKE